ncbi:hypothetical protein DFH27DRAFT_483388 [Peziza echinospora]|nr:hypothetical protein DFH27DRAFT_483388 [Peziza echinospora]
MSSTLSSHPQSRGGDDLLLQRNCELDYNSSSESRSDDDDDDDDDDVEEEVVHDADGRSSVRLRRRRRSVESSGVSTPSDPSPPPAYNRTKKPTGASLEVPKSRGAAASRSPSPLGLIPIHRSFSKLIHKHEVPRKLLHVSIGGLGIYLYKFGYQPNGLTPWIALALVPIAGADILRLKWDAFNRFYIRVLGALMRESEVRGANGVVFFLVGTLTVLTVFPKDVATLSILLLSWCDTAASTFGRAYGKYTPKIRSGKSLAGSLASFVVGAVTAALWWGWIVPGTAAWPNDPANALMWKGRLGIDFGGLGGLGDVAVTGGWALGLMSLWTGLAASASEVADIWGLDDNVIIPVLSAVGIWGFLKVFG